METTPPRTLKDLHRLLGIAAYFANRTPYSAIEAHPLRLMLKKRSIKEWTSEQLEALTKLKGSIILTFLAHFNNDWATGLIVDAGPLGVGIFLIQHHPKDEKEVNLIHCGSHFFTEV